LGISQRDFAFANSITIGNYQKMESAKMPINQYRLQEFAFLLNVPISYFYLESGYKIVPGGSGKD